MAVNLEERLHCCLFGDGLVLDKVSLPDGRLALSFQVSAPDCSVARRGGGRFWRSSPPSLLSQSAYFSLPSSCPRGCRRERGESSREVYYVIRAVRVLIVKKRKNLQSCVFARKIIATIK